MSFGWLGSLCDTDVGLCSEGSWCKSRQGHRMFWVSCLRYRQGSAWLPGPTVGWAKTVSSSSG
jgi:hypothetical protein